MLKKDFSNIKQLLEAKAFEMQQKVEDKRLGEGAKLEKLLRARVKSVFEVLDKILAQGFFAFVMVLLIFLLSIFLRSRFDIAAASMFKTVMLLSWLQLNDLNLWQRILFGDLAVDILGLVSLGLVVVILKKSALNFQQRNLFLIFSAIGFFLRPYAIATNDFVVQSSLYLAIIYPILALISWKDFFSKKLASLCYVMLPLLFVLCLDVVKDGYLLSFLIAFLTPILALFYYNFFKSDQLNIRKSWAAFFGLLIVALFDAKGFVAIKDLTNLWWVIFPVVIFFLKRKLSKANFDLSLSLTIGMFKMILIYVILLVLSFLLLLSHDTFYLTFSLILFFILLFFYEKFYQRFYQKFSSFFTLTQFFVISLLLAFYFLSISQSYSGNDLRQSPNYLSDRIATYSKLYANKSDATIFILSPQLQHSLPILNYLNKAADFFDSQAIATLYLAIDKKEKHDEVRDIFVNFKQIIAAENNKIIFINTNATDTANYGSSCKIGLLEYYFSDKNFRENFLRNYRFVGRISKDLQIKKDPTSEFFLTKSSLDELSKEWQEVMLNKGRMVFDFEVYLRSN